MIKSIGTYLLDHVSSMNIFDIIDIVLVSVIFYYLFKFVSDRRAGKLVVGILFIVVAMFLSDVLNMRTLNFILENLVQVGIIGLVIVFQAELRSFLEKMGGSSILNLNKRNSGDMQKIMGCINNVVEACVAFSEEKTGALLVFERSTKLGDVIRTGTVIDSEPTAFLIKNIFYNKAPLHDGALIIRDNRLYSAGCFLPLSQNQDIIKDLGTRHRAAIGMSENSDSIVVIVSEETGMISIAVNGVLTMDYTEQTLRNDLVKYLIGDEASPKNKNASNT